MKLSTMEQKLETRKSRCCRIYALVVGSGVDDRDIKYIGSSCRPLEQRLRAHLTSPTSGVAELLELEGRNGVRIVELLEVDEFERFEVEKLAIRLATQYGLDIKNKVWR